MCPLSVHVRPLCVASKPLSHHGKTLALPYVSALRLSKARLSLPGQSALGATPVPPLQTDLHLQAASKLVVYLGSLLTRQTPYLLPKTTSL